MIAARMIRIHSRICLEQRGIGIWKNITLVMTGGLVKSQSTE